MADRLDLSIIIPSFNSAVWLPGTIRALDESAEKSPLRVEIIVVNDGSTDDTLAVIDEVSSELTTPLRVVSTANQGVFAARLAGAAVARSETLLFVDARVTCAPDALAVFAALPDRPPVAAVVGHVGTATDVPLVGRFWEVPTHVFWGSYLRQPTRTVVTLENFDRVPKGTGFLAIDSSAFREASERIASPGDRFVSDDTKLLRDIAARSPIVLEPAFRAEYRPRTNLRKFLSHGYLRGTLFVDSYFGTSFLRSLVLVALAASVPVALVLVGTAWVLHAMPLVGAVVGGAITMGLALLAVAAVNRAPARALASFASYVVPFATVFWAGIVRGFVVRAKRSTR
ncbi:MAG TPA: glycosyltransferase family 2 protein [Microbacteriaceae bacterium]|nr:glycosyltransferase family 2 protein [Microbacteriaceae bacterium]